MLTLGMKGDRSKTAAGPSFSWFKGFKNGVMKNYGHIVLILLIAGLFALMGYVLAYDTIPASSVDTAKMVLPQDYSSSIQWNNTATKNFTCNVALASNRTLGNISLWLGLSSNFVRNTTNVSKQAWTNATDYNWTLTLNDGTYYWSCGLGANESISPTWEHVNSTNYTIKIDTAAPLVDAATTGGLNVSPRYNNFTSNQTPITVYVNLTDVSSGINLSTIVMAYKLNSSTTWTDGGTESITVIPDISNGTRYKSSITLPSLPAGTVDIQVNVSDNATNAMTTFIWYFTIDNAAPNVEAITLYNTNGAVINNNLTNSTAFILNITISDNSNLSTVTANDASTTKLNKTTNVDKSYYWIVTNMSNFLCEGEGLCTFTVTATDQAGNSNSSSFTVRVDNIPPAVSSFTSNASNVNARFASSTDFVNFTATVTDTGGSGVHTVYLPNASNISSVSGSTYFNATTLQRLGCPNNAWCLQLRVYANDSAGNVNNSVNYSVYLDTATPVTNATLDNVNDTGDGDGNVNLAWTDDAGETGETYRIYRHNSMINITTVESATLIATNFPEGIQYYEDNTTANGTTYWYALVTVDIAGKYNATNVTSNSLNATANDTIAPKLPTSVTATASGGTTTISWTNVTSDVNRNYDLVRYTVWYWKNITLYWNATSWETKTINETIATLVPGAGNISTNSTTHSLIDNNSIVYYYFVTTIDDGNNENRSIYNNSNINSSTASAPTCTNGVAVPSEGCSCGGTFYKSGYCCSSALSTSACTTASSSSSGGGGSATTTNAYSTSHKWATVLSGVLTSMSIDNTNIALTKLQFISSSSLSDAELKVTALTSQPSAVTKMPEDTLYQYLNVETNNILSDKLSSTMLSFRVPKSWVDSNSIDYKTIKLNRYENGNWNRLITTFTLMDNSYYQYSASTPGFSYFAVTGRKSEAAAQETAPPAGTAAAATNISESAGGEAGAVAKSRAWLGWLFVIMVIAGIVSGVYFYQKKKKPTYGFEQ